MAESSIEIVIPETSSEEYGRLLVATVTDLPLGIPLAGAPVRFRIEGHGTFDVSQWVTEVELITGDEGDASVEWFEFPRYRPRRALRAVVRASCDLANSDVRLVDMHAQGSVRVQLL
jgi:hypothetical protein